MSLRRRKRAKIVVNVIEISGRGGIINNEEIYGTK